MVRKIKIPVVPKRDNDKQKTLEAMLRCLENQLTLTQREKKQHAGILTSFPYLSSEISRY